MKSNIEINVQIMEHGKLQNIFHNIWSNIMISPFLKNEKCVIYTWNLQQIYEEELYPKIMTIK